MALTVVAPTVEAVRLPPTTRADLALAAAGMAASLVAADFVRMFGPSFTYLANTAIHLVVAAAMTVRRTRPVASFVATYAALGALAVLVRWTPVQLGVSPVLLAAPLSLYAVTRHARSRGWGIAGLLLAVAGTVVSPALTYGMNAILVAVQLVIVVLVYLWCDFRL